MGHNPPMAPGKNPRPDREYINSLARGLTVLRGSLAPEGAIVKLAGHERRHHRGPARVFDTEDLAVEALLSREVKSGDVVIIRYEGPKANGMPEMYYATAIIAASKATSSAPLWP